LEDSRLRHIDALNRLYLIAAVALLYATTTGMTVQLSGLRTTVDPHWQRGLSYLCLVQRTLRRPQRDCIRKIGLRYLRGVTNKGRALLVPTPLFYKDPEPCFASHKARPDLHNSIWFDRIVTITCKI
jgi:hypothetical protein